MRKLHDELDIEDQKAQALADLIEHMGNNKAAVGRLLGVTVQSVYVWIRLGQIGENSARRLAHHPVHGKKFPLSRTRPDLDY